MFRAKRRTAGRRNFEVVSSSEQAYLARLNYYLIPPTDEVTLEQFEQWAIDRLKVLIEIESCVARSKTFKETELLVKPLLLKYLPMTSGDSSQTTQERKKDHYSHFILRLVFCRTEELRKKFVKNELILFRIRYGLLQPKEQRDFISNHTDILPWDYISKQEKDDMFDDLFAATSSSIRTALLLDSNGAVEITKDQLLQHVKSQEQFIRLPFEKVPLLVASRLVLVRQGYAFIPSIMQQSLLVAEFQDRLNSALIKTFQAIPRLEEDDRLLPLLANLLQNFLSFEYDPAGFGNGEGVSDINAMSITTPTVTKHYPLCAKHLQNSLIVNSHLKYQARQQLGLFLKGIGLNVDEALKFWAHQFTKGSAGITTEKFNKEYKYNIRHNYGLEGARINYKPHDCARILNGPKPGKDEYHGCPYRDFPLEVLMNNLREMGISDQQDLNGVVDDVARHDYTVACTRVFELTHKKELEKAKGSEGMHINHPNLYFDRSRQLEKKLEA